jgi:hypothetical protein
MGHGQHRGASTLHLDDEGDRQVVEALSLFAGKRGELLRLIVVVALAAGAQYLAFSVRLAVIETTQQFILEGIRELKADRAGRTGSGAKP